MPMKTAKELAAIAAKALDSKKAVGLRLLKIDRVSSLADYFLICTGFGPMPKRSILARSSPPTGFKRGPRKP